MRHREFCNDPAHKRRLNTVHQHRRNQHAASGRWFWEAYHSGYGWGGGSADTRREAEEALTSCIGELVRGDF